MGMSKMGRILLSASLLAIGAGSAVAGGIERSAPSVAILFEDGNYVEFSLGAVDPDVQGTFLGAIGSGDMAQGYGAYTLGYKYAINEKLDLAITLDQPVGARVSYPISAAPYPFAGATAEVDSQALTALLRYKLPSHLSLIGGIRLEEASGVVGIPSIGGYTMSTDTDRSVGYVLGVAWEKPEIAARVALTYFSEITHELAAQEQFTGMPAAVATTFETVIPQSVMLDFQTGVAADTLLFGSIRWTDWSEFDITPPLFAGAPCGLGPCGSLADVTTDSTTYTLGLGRKFNEQWSGAIVLAYEGDGGVPVGNLGPTDGYKSIGLAATYTLDSMKITAGVRYIEIGDATTTSIGSQFTDNSGVAAGLRIGYTF